MANRATVTEASIRRAIKVAQAEGLVVRECIMRPNEVRLVFGKLDEPAPPANDGAPKQW